MSELKPPNIVKTSTPRNLSPEEEIKFLRKRVADLETQSQQLYQQAFLLQQRLSASSLNEKERAEFISHVAHELRTPLTSIKGYVDLVLEGETGPVNDLQRDFLNVVGLNAEKLSRIIGDLLDVSRLEAAQLGFKPVLTDFRTLVLETCEEVRPQLEAKGIEFDIVTTTTAQMIASIDPERFSQALRAIIAHAGEVTPVNGKVHLTVGYNEEGTYGVVTVEDQGPGIPPADLERVFTKFWRPSNQNWEGGGPGLGLAIAKSIIDSHEGQVRAENNPPEKGGSSIIITLPLIGRPVAELTPFVEEIPQEEEPRYAALVITQNPDFGKVMQQTLGQGGFQVIVANDRSELVAETPAWQPDLIINNGAEMDLLNEDESGKISPALRGAAILTLNLSPIEQRVIVSGAQAVLPWPAAENLILDRLEQTMVPDSTPEKVDQFKQTKTILLVSPSSDALRSLDRMLREAGYAKVYRAMREADALTLARRYRPDWLLLDIPPEASGSEYEPNLFEMLREDQLLGKTPTIVFLRPEQIAADPLPDYRPNYATRLVGSGPQRRITTDELKGRRGGTGELRARRGTTGELRARGGTGELNLRAGATDELKGPYYNIVPKPFMQRRLINVARRLASKR
ncbi:MAG TPA: hybrid sensor histidine kinase/response regulator [Chloroflexia bacterium]|nr:hybrid sensor histidine kinase/response regulator [Chloroflexia bacterium]